MADPTTGTFTFWKSRAVFGHVEIGWQHMRKPETAIVQAGGFPGVYVRSSQAGFMI